MNEKTKEKLVYYNRLSTLYFNTMVVLSGSIAGLILANTTIKTIILIIVAIIFDVMCITRHQFCNERINEIIEKGEV